MLVSLSVRNGVVVSVVCLWFLLFVFFGSGLGEVLLVEVFEVVVDEGVFMWVCWGLMSKNGLFFGWGFMVDMFLCLW